MNREKTIHDYRVRIARGERIKLTRSEQEFLISTFIKDLTRLRTEAGIKARCRREITLLEEGYPKETIAKNKLNLYRRAILEAVDTGVLELTNKNSREYEYEKKEGIEKTGEVCQAHHHFGWLYMCYDNDTYLSFSNSFTES